MKLFTLLPAVIGLVAAAPAPDSTPTNSTIGPGEYFHLALYDGPECTGKYSVLVIKDDCYPISARSVAVLAYQPWLKYSIFHIEMRWSLFEMEDKMKANDERVHGSYADNCKGPWMPIPWRNPPYCQGAETIKSAKVVL
ncbi:hypothetical protein K491DRAFT_683926 [Lophiostoma macrostomum CBS 122681]|uniref:Lytic polysaccharide monooxygenase n=1 Tax=Lophiostoma macrostomum CBS 122681 TaxID=1314788 RepID=A0A6A6SS06_9PLEO|nr:hypothetical protein K491DRAFT_683926 [Lophiostoma macrostomum CBS 122681]